MANTNTVLIPKILARALSVLRQRVIMPRLVNGDYSADAVKKGTQITIPIPVAVADQDVAPSNVLLAPTDVTPTEVTLPVDQHRHSKPIGLTDKEKTEIEYKLDFLPMQMEESIKGLANRLNQLSGVSSPQPPVAFMGFSRIRPPGLVLFSTRLVQVLLIRLV